VGSNPTAATTCFGSAGREKGRLGRKKVLMTALGKAQIRTELWLSAAAALSNNASKYNRYSADNRLSKHN